MTPGKRAPRGQVAERINAAVEILKSGLSVSEAIGRLALREGISERQARRYVERAQQAGEVEVPRPKQVFTVKLPIALVGHLKSYAVASHRTLSSLVTQAVEEFLGARQSGPPGGRPKG